MKATHFFLFVVLLAACGGSTPAADAGGHDAATPPIDGGDTADTGSTDDDAGAVEDTGVGVDAATAEDASAPADAFVDCAPHTFVVTSDGASYSFDGGPGNATLHLCAGTTYMFDLSTVAAVHPMGLNSGGTLLMAIPAGVTTSYTVPDAAPQPDAYVCTFHFFGGAIEIH